MAHWKEIRYFELMVVMITVAVVQPSIGQGDRNEILLQNGGYSNVVVALRSDVPENDALITNLMKLFTDASAILFNATYGRVYWRDITILLPLTWSTKPEYEDAQLETYETANIIVSDAASMENQSPVPNPFECGHQGLYIHMAPDYILDQTQGTESARAKWMVRQWAKFRWGVFDEHYEPWMYKFGARPCYLAPNEIYRVKGTRCSEYITGMCSLVDDLSMKCDEDSVQSEKCLFVPGTQTNHPEASLMFESQDVDSLDIRMFCDDSTHNGDVKNKNLHNLRCEYRSVWSVLNTTPDFADGSTPEKPESTAPSFRLVQTRPQRIVLVLDISGSMAGSRFNNMIQATTIFIRDFVQAGTSVGIVQFSTTSESLSGLVEVVDATSRDDLVSKLPLVVDGWTCIGCGLLAGIQILNEGIFGTPGGYIVLLSDGEENRAPYIDSTLGGIENASVIIDTIAISDSADQQMEDLSQRTRGHSAFCSDAVGPECVIEAFSRGITSRPEQSTEATPIQIYSSSEVLISSSSKAITVFIDAQVGNDTVIVVSWTGSSVVDVVLTRPDGTNVTRNDSRYSEDQASKIVTIRLATAEEGEWTITMSSTDDNDVSVTVSSKPISDDPAERPPTVYAFLGDRTVNYTINPSLVIFAHVHRNNDPVLNANVTATVEDTNGDTHSVVLQDSESNTNTPDPQGDDGIYKGNFLNFTTGGRYNVKTTVDGLYQHITEFRGVIGRRAVPEDEPTNTTRFMRTTSAGSFEVYNYIPNAPDILPPAKILDLSSEGAIFNGTWMASFKWTSPGDNLNQGTAFSHELRYNTNFASLRHDFPGSPLVTSEDVILGNLSIVSPAGTVQQLTIFLPDAIENLTHTYAIRARDEAMNVGPVSNYVSLSRPIPPRASTPSLSTPSTSTTAAPSTASPRGMPMERIIIISSSLGGLLVCVFLSCKSFCRFRAKFEPTHIANPAFDEDGP